MFKNIYNNKRVLITGHTGFKGSWLTTWLLKLGAEVIGVSDDIPTTPSMFEALNLEGKIEHHFCDIRKLHELQVIVENAVPDFIFHLAAQPIVSLSYQLPIDTITTNVVGTANVLECVRQLSNNCAVVIITSDKCYENVEWEWGYRETDHMGGKDIYSASKGAAELIFHAYECSFYREKKSNIKLATGRAGNVIGGGDWARDRIVVDCMRSWSRGNSVEIRSPAATRPWQHVLEPLSGYLTLAARLYSEFDGIEEISLNGESFNFGPRAEQNRTVLQLLDDLSNTWGFEKKSEAYRVTANIPFHEAGLLKLNCDKALFHLNWEANWTYEECVDAVSEWYYSFYRAEDVDIFELTMEQIENYEFSASKNSLVWTC